MRLARELGPDLVVLEMVLDGQVVGLELGRRLRHQADVLLVFATRHADVEDRLAALEAGGDDYLVKPFAENNIVLPPEFQQTKGYSGDFSGSEWAGATFEPKNGNWLFVNIQSPGVTFAITGPWRNGAL